MASDSVMTSFEVKALVYYWFKKITDHAPVEELLALLAPSGIEISFPDALLKSHDDFRNWYHTVTNKFFDQVHEIKMVDVVVDGSAATVHLVVNWQARTWEAPAAYSAWTGAYVHQTWRVIRGSGGAPQIEKYTAEKFDAMEGPLRI